MIRSTNEDISPRERALSNMMHFAPVGILQIDNGGVILEANAEGSRLLKGIHESFGLDGKDFFHTLERIVPGTADRMRKAPGAGGLIFAEEVYDFGSTGKAGVEQRQVTMTAIRLDADSYAVIFFDSTEKCRKEQEMRDVLREKAVEQGKSELAADILHDIGNAVVGLGSHLTRIRRSLENNKDQLLENLAGLFAGQQDQLVQAMGEDKAKAAINMLKTLAVANKAIHEEIRQSANGQLGILSHIQEILNIQRQYVAGRETGERQPVNLRGILTDSLSMLSATMEKRGIRVRSQLAEESALIKGDRTRLMQVVMNLLKNSIEAIDFNATDKWIGADLIRENGRMTLRISDSGCGFDGEKGGRLFERGFTTKSSGTGLGLYNCKEIVESHQGDITITSDGVGKGSVVTLQFNL